MADVPNNVEATYVPAWEQLEIKRLEIESALVPLQEKVEPLRTKLTELGEKIGKLEMHLDRIKKAQSNFEHTAEPPAEEPQPESPPVEAEPPEG